MDYSKILHNNIEDMTIKQIQERLDSLTNTCAQLSTKLNEFNAQEEVEKAHKEVEEIKKRAWMFRDKDQHFVDEFTKYHYSLNSAKSKNPTHTVSYIFTPTEVWDCAEVVCTCGHKLEFFY